MKALLSLVKGWAGKPSHPPLTDATIGAYTIGVVMLVLGAFGIEEEQMAHGALLAIGGGLIFNLATSVTGLLDWLDLPKGSQMKRTATIHLFVMGAASALFLLTFILQLDGYKDDVVKGAALVSGLLAEILLTLGGWIGGSLVFVYGIRVLKREQTPTRAALVPGAAEHRKSVQGAAEPRPADQTKEPS